MRLIFFALFSVVLFGGETLLLRYPDIHKDKIVFVHAGDLYLTSKVGGRATRLTSHPGRELFPKFSPDGRQIAYSAEYSGTRQLFTISAEGGTPRQLTFYNDVGPMPPRGGFDNQVLDWTPDGTAVLFKGNRVPWGERMGKYMLAPAGGGLETPLELPEAGGGMFSPDGKKLVYTPISREFRTWKRYRGGRAQDVWTYDLEKHLSKRLTDHPMTDNQPMWVGNKIYFTSDREYTLNLYEIDPEGGTPTRVTHHQQFDVLWPSAGPDSIVYEAGGVLHTFTPALNEDRPISVEIVDDFPQTFPQIRNLKDFIAGIELSPNGVRALFEARGDLFSIPADKGLIHNLTQTPGIRERDPAWSPDGKTIAYVSDRDGKLEICLRPATGGDERVLTKDLGTWPFPPHWSPDGKKLAFADKLARLMLVDATTGALTEVDKGESSLLTDFSWSTDGKWLVYTKLAANGFGVLHAYDLEKKSKTPLTSSQFNNFNPSFSLDGKYLFFLSNRDFNLTFSGFEFQYLYTNPTRIYAVTLNDGVPAPLAPQDLQEKGEESEPVKSEKTDKNGKSDKILAKTESKPETSKTFQLEGFERRVFSLPVPSGNYFRLMGGHDAVFYLGQDADGNNNLGLYRLAEQKNGSVLNNLQNAVLSRGGKHLLYQQGGDYGIVDAAPDQKAKNLNLDQLKLKIDPPVEWRQIFEEALLLTRHWFYDPKLHGYDLGKLGDKYRSLLPHVHDRADLDYLLSEFVSEFNAGHFYVNSGDQHSQARLEGGLLGADIQADPSGFYRIARILPGENWLPNFRSPLRDYGVKVSEGEFILAIDGQEIRTDRNFYEPLEGKANKVVRLLVNQKPSREGAREVRVQTIASEGNLFYLDWIQGRRALAEKLSGGKIGYIHVPNTAVEGSRELFRHYYAQSDKQALIIDDRYNGGGFIPDNMMQLLARNPISYWAQRSITPFQTPGIAHLGPKAMLINGYSSSGGDALPFYFRQAGMGKIYGTRTWGGLIGLQGNPSFVDGGSINVPVFRVFDSSGKWVVENEGVAPDVEVIDLPELIAKGQDPTLERAIADLLEELASKPPRRPTTPQPPDESKLR